MISYIEAKECLPSATHIYIGVSQDDIDAVTASKYVSAIGDVKLLGTHEPVDGLEELVTGSINFD